jgi:hypothetical protein
MKFMDCFVGSASSQRRKQAFLSYPFSCQIALLDPSPIRLWLYPSVDRRGRLAFCQMSLTYPTLFLIIQDAPPASPRFTIPGYCHRLKTYRKHPYSRLRDGKAMNDFDEVFIPKSELSPYSRSLYATAEPMNA